MLVSVLLSIIGLYVSAFFGLNCKPREEKDGGKTAFSLCFFFYKDSFQFVKVVRLVCWQCVRYNNGELVSYQFLF